MKRQAVVVLAALGIGILGAVVLAQSRNTVPQDPQAEGVSTTTPDIVSQVGIHWHSKLSVIIKGERQVVLANIGIGMQYAGYPLYDPMMMMTDMHTHDTTGELHWEVMEGPVQKEDVRLGTFFAVWGKKFDASCVFEYCNGEGGVVKMFVNGKENAGFQNYLINDKDIIEIRYE